LDQLLTIDILGQPFTFKTDSDIIDAQEMADFVVKSVHQASEEYTKRKHPPDNRAILLLAALNIANEYFDLKKKHQQMLSDLSQRSAQLLNTLDA
jgi:cell division protein ZapA (FtsZ GTPase activity inhibitor)